MTSRLADGSDKIVAFERGMLDDKAALAFETQGVTAFVVDETYLSAFAIDGVVLVEKVRARLYDGQGTPRSLNDFIEEQARDFGCLAIDSLAVQ